MKTDNGEQKGRVSERMEGGQKRVQRFANMCYIVTVFS